MKRIIFMICIMMALSVSVFAGGRYHGDIQFHMGGTDVKTYLKSYETDNSIMEEKFNTKQICFDIATWHMWNLNNCFSLGFAVDFYGGFGNLDSWSAAGFERAFKNDVKDNYPVFGGIFVGPAFGIQIWKIAKLSVGVGVVYDLAVLDCNNLSRYSTDRTAELLSSVGIGADIQLKLFPTCFFSPLIGYRCSVGIGDRITAYDRESGNRGYSAGAESDFAVSVKGTLYAGFSFNW